MSLRPLGIIAEVSLGIVLLGGAVLAATHPAPETPATAPSPSAPPAAAPAPDTLTPAP